MRNLRIDAGRARSLPGVALILTAADLGDLGDVPCLFNFEVDPFHRSGPIRSSAKDEGAPCRRRRRLRGGRRHRSRARRHRGDQGELVAAAGGRGLVNAVKKDASRSAPDKPATSVDVPVATSRRPRKPSRRRMRSPKSPSSIRAWSQASWDPRCDLRIRRQARSSDADRRQPGQPSAGATSCARTC